MSRPRPTPWDALRQRTKFGTHAECWTWIGSTDKRGYGRLWANGSHWKAHRLAYTLLTGTIPDGLELHHTCRNPSCVNPDHLEPVTHAEHMRLRRQDKCIRGHALTADNVRLRSNGHRYCLPCAVERTNERRKRRAPVHTHGFAGYSHGCRCDECRAANAKYQRERYARLRDSVVRERRQRARDSLRKATEAAA